MNPLANKAICLVLALQVGLVGALGTGLHSLLGCEHGARLSGGGYACSGCCVRTDCVRTDCGCEGDSPFQRRREAQRRAAMAAAGEAAERGESTLVAPGASRGGCHGPCSLCELLQKYHSAAASESAPLLSTPTAQQRVVLVDNADVVESTRLADSRGPPASSLS